MHMGIWVREILLAHVIPVCWAVKHRTNYTELKVYNKQIGFFFQLHFKYYVPPEGTFF